MCSHLVVYLGFILVLTSPGRAADPVAEGDYKLAVLSTGTSETTYCLIKVEKNDGKLTGSLLATHPQLKSMKLEAFTVRGHAVTIVLKTATSTTSFEGLAFLKDNRNVWGSYGDERRLSPARLVPTELTSLEQKDLVMQVDMPLMKEIADLNRQPQLLRVQAQREPDPAKKAELLKQRDEALQAAQTKVPKLYQEIVEKQPQKPQVFEAALSLIQGASKRHVSSVQVANWATTAERCAADYGHRYQDEIRTQLAARLVHQEGCEALGAHYAQLAEQSLKGDTPVGRQVQVLKTLSTALQKTGKLTEAKQTADRVERLEELLDKEYFAKLPEFKPVPFAGRTAKSERVAVMELFTGAQCPPCVAADVAFDYLQKTYKAKDLVLIQYHLHIPGPDPLTNADTEARAAYYDVHSTPSTFFNGAKQSSGGGPIAFAEKKYGEYQEVINPLLEKPEGAKVKVTAARTGNQVAIKIDVAKLKDAGMGRKLRVLLVEETIRYVGGNNLRFHHHVVRAFPGGVNGTALKAESSEHAYKVDLDAVRKQLNQYLNNYVADKQAFPNADRPLELNKLRVIALVQDDETKEIVQAAQVEVGGDREKK